MSRPDAAPTEQILRRYTVLLREAAAAAAALSPLERQVLGLLAGGSTTRQIAQELGLAPAETRQLLERVCTLLGVNTPAAAGTKWALLSAAESASRRLAAPAKGPDPTAPATPSDSAARISQPTEYFQKNRPHP